MGVTYPWPIIQSDPKSAVFDQAIGPLTPDVVLNIAVLLGYSIEYCMEIDLAAVADRADHRAG